MDRYCDKLRTSIWKECWVSSKNCTVTLKMLSFRSRASSDARTLYVPLELLNARLDTLSIISSISHQTRDSTGFLPHESTPDEGETPLLSRNNTYESITYYRSKTSINLVNHCGPSQRHVLSVLMHERYSRHMKRPWRNILHSFSSWMLCKHYTHVYYYCQMFGHVFRCSVIFITNKQLKTQRYAKKILIS